MNFFLSLELMEKRAALRKVLFEKIVFDILPAQSAF